MITFDTNADYDNNFWEVTVSSTMSRNAGGYVSKTNLAPTALAAIYNTSSTGGSGGSGGTAGGMPISAFGGSSDFTIEAGYRQASLGSGNNLTLYTKITDGGGGVGVTSGYAALLSIESATTARFSLFDSDGNPSASGLGTQIGLTQVFTTSGSFLANTLYTFRLKVQDVGSNVHFTAQLFDGITQIGGTLAAIDSSAAILGAGQVGFRLRSATGTTGLDSFEVAVVPEPSVCGLVVFGWMGLAWARRCRRRTIHRFS